MSKTRVVEKAKQKVCPHKPKLIRHFVERPGGGAIIFTWVCAKCGVSLEKGK